MSSFVFFHSVFVHSPHMWSCFSVLFVTDTSLCGEAIIYASVYFYWLFRLFCFSTLISYTSTLALVSEIYGQQECFNASLCSISVLKSRFSKRQSPFTLPLGLYYSQLLSLEIFFYSVKWGEALWLKCAFSQLLINLKLSIFIDQ